MMDSIAVVTANIDPHVFGLTIKWHLHFMKRARLVATCSKDPSTQCGAVVIRTDKTPITDGYNGFPRDMDDDPALYLDREYKYEHIIHAEANALLNCNRQGGSTMGTIMYVTHPPCPGCSGKLKQAGVCGIVYEKPSADFKSRWDMDKSVTHFKRIKMPVYELCGGKMIQIA